MKKYLPEKQGERLKKAGCLALAVVITGAGLMLYRNFRKTDIPKLVIYTDPGTVTAAEDEVPLAAGTSTTKKVSTKTTIKKTKMKKAAAKTRTNTEKSTKINNKIQKSASIQVKTNTKAVTTVKISTKKKSKIKTTKTTIVTTVTTTTTRTVSTTDSAGAGSAAVSESGSYNVKSVAAACDARVLRAFTQMGCQLIVDPGAAYSGCFDAFRRTITMKRLNSTLYHELGHFTEFTGGTFAVKQAIADAYHTEKSLYTAQNRAYVLQNSSEYFAESFKNYCENPALLQQERPNTYHAIVLALNNITEARVNSIISVYSAIWK